MKTKKEIEREFERLNKRYDTYESDEGVDKAIEKKVVELKKKRKSNFPEIGSIFEVIADTTFLNGKITALAWVLDKSKIIRSK